VCRPQAQASASDPHLSPTSKAFFDVHCSRASRASPMGRRRRLRVWTTRSRTPGGARRPEASPPLAELPRQGHAKGGAPRRESPQRRPRGSLASRAGRGPDCRRARRGERRRAPAHAGPPLSVTTLARRTTKLLTLGRDWRTPETCERPQVHPPCFFMIIWPCKHSTPLARKAPPHLDRVARPNRPLSPACLLSARML